MDRYRGKTVGASPGATLAAWNVDGYRRKPATTSTSAGTTLTSWSVDGYRRKPTTTSPGTTLTARSVEGQSRQTFGAAATLNSSQSLRWNVTTPPSSFVTALGVDGLPRKRLPPLGKPLHGSWSAPVLADRGATQGMGLTPGRPDATTPEPRQLRQQQANRPTAWTRSAYAAGASQTPSREKKMSVWQRWQVQTSSNRLQREEVLERDRQRQRALIGAGEPRQSASPARSHAASLFFAHVPGGNEVSETLPPGALRHVARPQTRNMQLMPNDLPGIAAGLEHPTGQGYGLNRKSARNALSSASSKGGNKDVEIDLPDEAHIFDVAEIDELNTVLDAYVHLLAVPSSGDFGRSPSRMSTHANARSESKGYSSRIANGPFIPRPLFCRLLLASGLCGSRLSTLKYHETVASFDEYVVRQGAFSGMPRSIAVRVLGSILAPKEDAPANAPKPPTVHDFFRFALPSALKDCQARQERLKERLAACAEERLPCGIQVGVPTAPTAEEVANPVRWPPLPPRCIMLEDLPTWTNGVRQWEEEHCQQSAELLRALRAHTASVLRGETLACQLLEPEVLHFATRFRPLFTRLFEGYADWPAPPWATQMQDAAKEERTPDAPSRCSSTHSFGTENSGGDLEDTASQVADDAVCGHMSFAAFFRVCVDFGVFPGHASFEEIQQIYKDAETVLVQPAPRLTEESEVPAPPPEEISDAPRSAKAAYARSASRGSMRRPSTSPRPVKLHEERLDPDKEAKAEAARRAAEKKAEKVAEKAAVLAAAAAAAAEAAMPKIDSSLFEPPLAGKTPQEMRVLSYLGAVDEWLGEHFVRLTDFATPPGSSPGDTEAATADGSVDHCNSTDNLSTPKFSGGISPSGISPSRSQQLADTLKDREKKASTADASRIATLAYATAAAAIPPIVTMGPQRFMEVTRMMGKAMHLELDEVEQMFRLITAGPNEDMLRSLEVPAFHLNKALRKARKFLEKVRSDCCEIFRDEAHQSRSTKACRQFLEAFDQQLLEKHRVGFDSATVPKDLFDGHEKITPAVLLAIGADLGIDPQLYPAKEDLGNVLVQFGADNRHVISKGNAYRALALVHERRRLQRQAALRAKLTVLSHTQRSAPTNSLFGPAPFVECLLKLALHRLGSKGQSEIQRGAPAWWKCTWLLSLFSGQFNEQIRFHDLAARLDTQTAAAYAAAASEQPADPEPPPSPPEPPDEPEDEEPMCRRSTDCPPNRRQMVMRKTVEEHEIPARPSLAEMAQARSRSKHKTELMSRGTVTGGISLNSTMPLRLHEDSRGAPERRSPSKERTLTRPRDGLQRRHTFTAPQLDILRENMRDGKAAKAPEPSLAQALDTWWQLTHRETLPEYLPPLASFVREQPRLFESASAEAPVEHAGVGQAAARPPCSVCKEPRSPSGWGNPGCLLCGGTEEHCLPLEDHLLGALLPSCGMPWTESEAEMSPPDTSRRSTTSGQSHMVDV